MMTNQIKLWDSLKPLALYFSWVVSCAATLISVFHSYILNMEPCILCHYQRICLFPLTIILGIASYKKDYKIKIYTLPIVFIGFLIAVYQVCLQEIPGMQLDICGKVSCASKTFIFGFLTMPMASAFIFCIIGILLAVSEEYC